MTKFVHNAVPIKPMDSAHKLRHVTHLVVLRNELVKPYFTAQDYVLRPQEDLIRALFTNIEDVLKSFGFTKPEELNVIEGRLYFGRVRVTQIFKEM
jgi:hypothetical protein